MRKSVSNPAYRKFRELLIDARQRSGITQTDLAIRLARPQSFISKFENGERRLDVVEFIEVAHAIGIGFRNCTKPRFSTDPELATQPAIARALEGSQRTVKNQFVQALKAQLLLLGVGRFCCCVSERWLGID